MALCDKKVGHPDGDRRRTAHAAYLAHLYHVATCDLPRRSRISERDVADFVHPVPKAISSPADRAGKPMPPRVNV